MSFTHIVYITDPPQWQRGFFTMLPNTQYLVGDRITLTSSMPPTTYQCTGAGISGALGFAGEATWGTSTWAVVAHDSWATAATGVYGTTGEADDSYYYEQGTYVNHSNILVYVDAFSSRALQIGSSRAWLTGDIEQSPGLLLGRRSVIVVVDPATMKPRRVCAPVPSGTANWQNTVGGSTYQMAVVGGHAGTNGWRLFGGSPWNRLPDGVTRPIMPVDGCYSIMSRYMPTSTQINDGFGNSKIADVSGTAALSSPGAAGTTRIIGAATSGDTITIPSGDYAHFTNETAAAVAGYTQQYNTAVGTPIVGGTAHLGTSCSGSTIRNAAFRLDGQYSSLIEDTKVYRSGVWDAYDQPISLVMLGSTTISPASMQMSSWIPVLSQLTGSRTITAYAYCTAGFTDLANKDVWMEVMYGGTASSTMLSFASNMDANFGAPETLGTAYAEDTATTWVDGYSLFKARRFKMSVTVSISTAVPILVRFVIASRRMQGCEVFVCPFVSVV